MRRDGGFGDRGPGFSSDDVRQLRGEARRWAAEAQDLRNLMREEGLDASALDEILRQLRQMDDDRVYRDAAELARLQAAVAEGLKRFEFDLRRAVGSEADRAAVTSFEEVPSAFRPLVEEYYRSLSKAPPLPR